MKTSPKGLALLKKHEGFRSKAYKDIRGAWTIGYGTTDSSVAFEGNTITKQQAEDYLAADLAEAEAGVRLHTKVKLSPEMFDALVSLVYNIGVGAYKKSTLLKKLNKGDVLGAAEQFSVWTRAGSQRNVPGLISRRAQEKALFLSGVDSVIEETNAVAAVTGDRNPKIAAAGTGGAFAVEAALEKIEPLAMYSEWVMIALLVGTVVWLVWSYKK